MKQRSDAAGNRADLLVAATGVFAEQGIDAPLDLVRKRAGVGRATMYRHFPDRRSLHLALIEDSLARFEAAGEPATLRDLLQLAAREAARSPALHAVWSALRTDPVAPSYIDRLRQVFAAPLQRARDSGAVSPALGIEDMFLVVRMLGAASRGPSANTRHLEAERALFLLATGLGIDMTTPSETTP